MSDFVILSNFRATIGIVSPTLLIAWFQRSETTEVVKVAQNFSSTVGQVVKTLPFHGGNMGSIPIRCIFCLNLSKRAEPSSHVKCAGRWSDMYSNHHEHKVQYL